MAFPTDPLPLVTERLIGGVWTDISADVRIASGITVTRGRADESSQPSPSRSKFALENSDGKYSSRNALSPYYRLLGRGTQVRHRVRWIRDTFGRIVSNGWGSADTGQAWTTNGGLASDYSVNGSKGFHRHTTVNVMRNSIINLPAGAYDVQVAINPSVTATGASLTGRVALGTSVANYYGARLDFTTGGTVTLAINKNIGGVGTTVKAAVTVGTYTPADQWFIRIQRRFGFLRAKAWPFTSAEPAAWTLVSDNQETEIPGFTVAMPMSRAETGNTDVNPIVAFYGFSVNDYWLVGETSASGPVADPSGNDVIVPVEAAGILQRLGTRTKPLRSALFRTISGIAAGTYLPYVYWPMEDGSGATQFASGLPGGTALPIYDGVTPASLAGPPGSAQLPQLAAGAAIPFTVPAYGGSQIAFQWLVQVPSEPGAETTLAEFFCNSGPVRRWLITIVPGSPSNVWIYSYDASGALIAGTGIPLSGISTVNPAEADFYGHWIMFTFGAKQNGGNVDAWLGIATGPRVGINLQSNSAGAGTLGTITGGTLYAADGGGVGHLVAYTDTGFDLDSSSAAANVNIRAMLGFPGETAADRMVRLCGEENIPFELIGSSSDTKATGPQQAKKLLDLLFDCVDVDRGILYEPQDMFGLGYRTLASLYNQSGPSVSYPSGKLGYPFLPVEDRQLLVNDVTVSRINGSSARYQITSGYLSTQDPPSGVGTYDTDVQANLFTDDQCLPLAQWIAAQGTWDEARYPVARFEMAAPDLAADVVLSGQVAAFDVGDVFTVTNLPVWQSFDPAGLMVQGMTISVTDGYTWSIDFNCVPSGPYNTGVYDDARWDDDTTTTTSSLTTSATTVPITVASGAPWITGALPPEFPYTITIDGEDMLVTSCVLTGTNTYNLTVIRSINGLVKSHLSGWPVHVRNPGYATYA